MGKQDLMDFNCVSTERECYRLDGEQDLSDCDYVSAERERYLLDGGAGFEGF